VVYEFTCTTNVQSRCFIVMCLHRVHTPTRWLTTIFSICMTANKGIAQYPILPNTGKYWAIPNTSMPIVLTLDEQLPYTGSGSFHCVPIDKKVRVQTELLGVHRIENFAIRPDPADRPAGPDPDGSGSKQWRIQDLPKGGGRAITSVRSACLNGGLGAEPLAGYRGRGGSGELSPPEAESFLHIFTQKVAKS